MSYSFSEGGKKLWFFFFKLIKMTHLGSHLVRQRSHFLHILGTSLTFFFLVYFFHTTWLIILVKNTIRQIISIKRNKLINYIPFQHIQTCISQAFYSTKWRRLIHSCKLWPVSTKSLWWSPHILDHPPFCINPLKKQVFLCSSDTLNALSICI